jgi:hypothetical protein
MLCPNMSDDPREWVALPQEGAMGYPATSLRL